MQLDLGHLDLGRPGAETRSRCRRIATLLNIGLVFLAVGASAQAGMRSPILNQARLIEAFVSAPGLLIGTVTDVEGVVHGGWLATIDLERKLRSREGEAKAPSQIEVAWEEPIPTMPARFETGQRILLAIESLSTASIWKQRVPDPVRRSSLYSVADKANAYLERPSASELLDLEHYLALGIDARRGNAGVVYLAALASRAQPRLAISALSMLEKAPDLSKELDTGTANHLCNAVMRAGREPGEIRGTAEADVSEAALTLLERRRPEGLRPVLKARIAKLEPSAPAVLYAALGAIDGSIPDDVALELLASASVEHRVAAARFASGQGGRERIRHLLRWDPDPAVRAVAVKRLLELEGADGLSDAIRGLDDPVPDVRLASMRAIATLDPEAIRDLEYVVDSGSKEGARSAVVTLSFMGAEAHQLLLKISEQHPDESLRALAGIAVGKPIGHTHSR